MPSQKFTTDPCWFSDLTALTFPVLSGNRSADILIIGSGLTGLLTAYALSKAGKKVTVVDASDGIGGGETGCTTAHLTWVLDSRYSELEKSFNFEKAQQVLKSHQAGIDFIETIAREEKIDCGFKRVSGYTLFGLEEKEFFETELETLHRLGAVETRLESPMPNSFLGKGTGLHYPHQAQFHPLKFLSGLAACLQKHGCTIFGGTRIAEVGSGKVKTETGDEILANEIIVATHSPVKNILFFLKEAAYRSYVIAAKIKKGEVPEGLYCDTENPYHYVRTQPLEDESDLLIIGGEDHKTGQNDDYEAPFQRLESWARANFPMIQKIDYAWSGQIIEPVDGLAFIGPSPYHGHLFIATGYSGNGMTYGAIAAMIFRDTLLGKKNPWAELYNPTRKNPQAIPSFLKENANVVKELVTGHLQRGDIENAEDLPPGEGGVLQKGLTHLAVFRDAEGRLHASSATCTHLGCVVQWNSAQKTFDCPCHGARFSGRGEVICGPAIRDLKKETLHD